MYMHCGGWAATYIIYKERGTGAIFVVEVYADRAIGQRLVDKALSILKAADTKMPPRCECGRCK
jgi:hypothetical protein